MLLSKAIEGYFYDKQPTYSPDTLESYKYVFRHLIGFIGDKEITEVTADELKNFISWLQKDYKPSRWSGDESPLSASAVDLHWKGTRSLFKWANETLETPRPDLKMPRPKFMRPHVSAFTEEEVRKLVRSCDYVEVERGGKKHRQRIPHAHRDKALILTLLDTGMRIGELLRVALQDVDLENGEITVTPYRSGKKSRPRIVVIGKTAKRGVWLWVAKMDVKHDTAKLFPMSELAVRLMLKKLGARAGVTNVHPHRFRHTFAIWYLRGGGDQFTLQRLLGHADPSMTGFYLDIAQTDLAKAHASASAVDRWNSEKPL